MINQIDTSKYGIIYIGNQHFYKEDLSTRDYLLENTSPYYFKIENDEFVETSWSKLLQEVINYLILEFDPLEEDLLNFSSSWTKTKIFFKAKEVKNVLELCNGLYVNINHTALHSCWLLQDLLKFFGIDIKNVELIIKRQPCSEKREVREFYANLHKEQFETYIICDLKKDKETYSKIIDGLEKADQIFKKFFPTWVSLFLFDSAQYFINYKSDFFDILEKKTGLPDKVIDAIKKRVNIYYEFMKKYYK